MQQIRDERRRPGVEHSFDDLVRAELPGLLRFATALCGDPDQARDLVQDVLTRAFVKWDRVGSVDRPAAYLMRMVTNEFLSWRRRWTTRTVFPSGHLLEDADERTSVRDHSDAVVVRDDLDRRLATLPRRQQAALVLRFYQGLDYAESADVLGCAEGTVRSAVSRGLATLRLDDIPSATVRTPAGPLTRSEAR